MRITIEKNVLLEGVQRVQNVVDKKNTIPVLSNVLFESDTAANLLNLTATNLEVGISTKLPITEGTEGSITIPAQKIFEILRELPDTVVTLVVDENHWITLECANANFRLGGLPKTDFPELPLFTSQDVVGFPQPLLRDMIGKTAFAVSHDESRYALTGLLFSVTSSDVSMVATDGHRLAVVKKPHSLEFGDQPVEVIIPLKAITEVKKLCDGEDFIAVNLSESQIAFRKDDTVLVSRLIDAQFPDYRQVIPAESRISVNLDKEVFNHAIRRVSLLCGDSKLIKFHLSANTLSLSANDPNLGEAKESMPVAYSGDDLSIGFNARYVLDFLSVAVGEQVILKLNDSLSPGLFMSDAEEDGGFSCVVMPMRV
jgi:DNA polymerase III subunit beta